MPKIPADAKKIIAASLKKPQLLVAERLEIAADREGMEPHDLIRFPDLLIKHRIRPEEATHGAASQAWRIYREKTDALILKYNEPTRFYKEN